MSKLANLNVSNALAPFKSAIGAEETFAEIVGDIVSLLGDNEKNLVSKVGDWKMSDKGILSTKEGHKLALPINNCAVILLKFGMQAQSIAKASECELEFDDVPKACRAWLTEKSKRIAARNAEKLVKA